MQQWVMWYCKICSPGAYDVLTHGCAWCVIYRWDGVATCAPGSMYTAKLKNWSSGNKNIPWVPSWSAATKTIVLSGPCVMILTQNLHIAEHFHNDIILKTSITKTAVLFVYSDHPTEILPHYPLSCNYHTTHLPFHSRLPHTNDYSSFITHLL